MWVDISMPDVVNVMDDFKRWMYSFKGIETQQQLASFIKRKNAYVEPIPHVLDKRWEVCENCSTSKQSQVELDDLFYYVPIEHAQSFVDLARLL